MLKRAILLLIAVSVPFLLSAEKVKVRIYSATKITQAVISFDVGRYVVRDAAGNIISDTLDLNRSVEVRLSGGKVWVAANAYELGTFDKISITAVDSSNLFCINPTGKKQRTYEGDVCVKVLKNNQLEFVSEVDFETYIAGVVQSEIYGKPDQTDIFRVQAIISRTWALRNKNKHKSDGYNFCDDVHCQAYYNRCIRPEIVYGTLQSVGEILVDKDGKPIDTPFHSNSGGQTANSEDVWSAKIPYLRSVPDTFSYRMKQSVWKMELTRNEWLNYFSKKHKLDISDSSLCDELLNFRQDERKSRIHNIPLTRLRTDFKLKSTFFTVSTNGNKVTLNGRGYGHGVGLSQEGAIRMVSLGYKYQEILMHYYKGAIIYRDMSIVDPKYQGVASDLKKIIEEDKKDNVKASANKGLEKLYSKKEREEREEVYVEEEQD
ncbi:MAG: SpoIID/LytB domain-containing protein, partial [Bacteroidales bacterium]|nr:SpoIID/LytB domain-containing protein [Bacteroidales bacterium]